MSTDPLKDVEELFQVVYKNFKAMPVHARPNDLEIIAAEIENKIIGVYQLQMKIAYPELSCEGTTSDLKERDKLTQARTMLDGLQNRMSQMRSDALKNMCRSLPPPIKNKNPENATTRALHEMVFVDTDCFTELSSVQPGKHGWIFIFRDELKDWLLSALEPFQVVYQKRDKKRKQYGLYKAMVLPGVDMIGPEFARLSSRTREIIVTHRSRSNRGSGSYDAVHQNFLLSMKTLPCILLQCVELTLGANEDSGIPQTVSVQNPVDAQLQSTGLPSPGPPAPRLLPPVQILKRGSDQGLTKLLNSSAPASKAQAPSGGPRTPPRAQQPSSSVHMQNAIPLEAAKIRQTQQFPTAGLSRQTESAVDNDQTPKARSAPQSSSYVPRSATENLVIYSASASHSNHTDPASTRVVSSDGWYNAGNNENTAGGAPAAHQTSHHQNLIQRQVVPRPEPMPLQSGARSNQSNPQYGIQGMQYASTSVPHKKLVTVPNSALSTRSQVLAPVAPIAQVYRPPQIRPHYAMQDQNINTAWNSTDGNSQAARTHRHAPQQNAQLPGQHYFDATVMQGSQVHQWQGAFPPRFQASSSNWNQWR
ncbi:hypothetical protein FPV67DRAFT_294337 [Lyophyllum atratum]|nr:hypothetical protein FPV67DRAFT_294337 [Lyophyllum atratum]